MGQYYRAVLKSSDGSGEKMVFSPQALFVTDEDGVRFSDRCGLKLTEHSQIGNFFSDSVVNILFSNKPMFVAWVGDYCEDVVGGARFYKAAWDELNSKSSFLTAEGCKFDYTGKFLVNYTKHEYVSYDNYLATVKSNWDKAMPFNPLVLLTAVGNGLGGGDYYCKNRFEYDTYDMIGSWAGDLIGITESCPKPIQSIDDFANNWVEIFPKFVEYYDEEYIKRYEANWNPDWRLEFRNFRDYCKKYDCLNKPIKQRRLELSNISWEF